MDTLQPKLRYKDYQGNWEKKTLNDIGEFIGGGTPSTSNDEFWNGEINWFTPTEIKNDFVDVSLRKISKFGLQKSSAKLLPIGTILLTTRATIGDVAIAKKECATNQGFQSLVTNDNHNNYFIFNWFKKSKHLLLERANGSTFPEISKSAIEKITLFVPSLEEQTKIANFLSVVDEKINLLKVKKSLLEEYKKGIMQKIFNQEIRFKDENGNDFEDWDETKLGNLTGLIHGDGDWILSKDLTLNGKYKLIQLGNIGLGKYKEKNLKTISNEKFIELKGTLLQKGDLLINRMVDNNLYACILDKKGDYITSVDVCWIRENKDLINNYFLMSVLIYSENQTKLLNLSSGSGRVRISKSNLFNEFYFKLPSIMEQTKIANFLSAIDEKIELVSNQIEDTQEYKKGLLQKMFV